MVPATDASVGDVPIRVQTRFERFPASIKGAFVMAGADGNPHVVRVESADVVRSPGGVVKPVPLEDRQLDVAPARDLFVPFEVAVVEMEPGWYRLTTSVRVDGGRVWGFESRPFTIPWPRNDVRRGTVVVGRSVLAGTSTFLVDRIELGADASIVVWRPDPRKGEAAQEETAGEAILLADGDRLDAVPGGASSRAFAPRVPGERRSVSYPVPKGTTKLEVVVYLGEGSRSEPLPVSLA